MLWCHIFYYSWPRLDTVRREFISERMEPESIDITDDGTCFVLYITLHVLAVVWYLERAKIENILQTSYTYIVNWVNGWVL